MRSISLGAQINSWFFSTRNWEGWALVTWCCSPRYRSFHQVKLGRRVLVIGTEYPEGSVQNWICQSTGYALNSKMRWCLKTLDPWKWVTVSWATGFIVLKGFLKPVISFSGFSWCHRIFSQDGLPTWYCKRVIEV